MRYSFSRHGRLLLAGGIVFAALTGASTAGAATSPGAVYTQDNDPAGNAVQMFERAADGTLSSGRSFPTGGVGLATLGGRQGAVELSDDEHYVYAVNAGSNTVTTFRVAADGLENLGSVASGGTTPTSVDERAGRVYVLNSGGTPNVTTFASGQDGTLSMVADGSRGLPGAQGAAQVAVAPDGSALVVSERLSNRLETLALDATGRPGAPVITPSNGRVPFGFAFGHRGDVLVSEAGASSVSSYRLGSAGALQSITASLPVGFGAACWLAASPNGKFAYTGNASGSITGFGIDPDGSLTALGTVAVQPSPRDLGFSRNGRYLYAVSPGNAGTPGRLSGYRVAVDGTLTQITSVPAAAPGMTGVAAG
jgi:6-phosphogluconolactonase (cycloisomerase 2 family)